MKYKIRICCLAVGLLLSSHASRAGAFENGSNGLNFGIGFGGYYGSYYSGLSNRSESPVLSLSYEHGQWDAGPGVISWGLYGGYKTIKYTYTGTAYYSGYYDYTYTKRWNYIVLGARAAWHFTKMPVEKLDVYGGVIAGLYLTTYTYSDNDPHHDYGYDLVYPSSFHPSLFVGARYLFATNFGAFAEAGYGASFLSIGLCLKFP